MKNKLRSGRKTERAGEIEQGKEQERESRRRGSDLQPVYWSLPLGAGWEVKAREEPEAGPDRLGMRHVETDTYSCLQMHPG